MEVKIAIIVIILMIFFYSQDLLLSINILMMSMYYIDIRKNLFVKWKGFKLNSIVIICIVYMLRYFHATLTYEKLAWDRWKYVIKHYPEYFIH